MRLLHCATPMIALAVASDARLDARSSESQVAPDTQARMVGLTKERVLVCMGPPAARAAEGATEV